MNRGDVKTWSSCFFKFANFFIKLNQKVIDKF